MAHGHRSRKTRSRAVWPTFALAIAFATPAAAQLVPLGAGGPLALPGGITQSLPPTIGRTTSGVDNTVDGALQTTTSIVRDVVGRPRNLATATDLVDGARIVHGEVLAVAATAANLAIARNLGFTILRQDAFASLGLSATVLRAPEGMDTAGALAALRRADPGGEYDYNHVYGPSGGDAMPSAAGAVSDTGAAGATSVGMIDAGVDRDHPALRHIRIESECFAGDKAGPPTAHGTAVASLLAGQDDDFHGALRHTKLYAADVYGGLPSGGSAESIVRALAWLSQNDVAVINISLSGPPNILLAAATAAAVSRGHVLVAAVGNDGPAAPERYPAAYPGVVGVTSVDSARGIQLDANRGRDVAFAARGVDVRVAVLNDGYARLTGTSFAAPVVAARFALLVRKPDPAAVARAWNVLEHDAVDLGAPGRDSVFGYGYIEAPVEPVAEPQANATN